MKVIARRQRRSREIKRKPDSKVKRVATNFPHMTLAKIRGGKRLSLSLPLLLLLLLLLLWRPKKKEKMMMHGPTAESSRCR